MIRVHKLGLIMLLWLPLACMTTVPKTPEPRASTLPTAIVVTQSGFITTPSTSPTANPGLSTLPVIPTANSSDSEYLVRVRMSTTSDWTTFALIDGAIWRRSTLISASSEATDNWHVNIGNGHVNNRFLLTQPFERAEAGASVEMVFETYLIDVENGGMLIFEIERGHFGATQVEISSYVGGNWVLVEAFVWNKIKPGERNASNFQIPAEKLMSNAP